MNGEFTWHIIYDYLHQISTLIVSIIYKKGSPVTLNRFFQINEKNS